MELKWEIDGRYWRLYYCEPPKLYHERVMLGLLFSEKVSIDSQDSDMDVAAERWNWWQARN
jgi:hypothetical protein